jgi:hypothetical protein
MENKSKHYTASSELKIGFATLGKVPILATLLGIFTLIMTSVFLAIQQDSKDQWVYYYCAIIVAMILVTFGFIFSLQSLNSLINAVPAMP